MYFLLLLIILIWNKKKSVSTLLCFFFLQNVKKPALKPKTINKMLLAASAKAKKPKVRESKSSYLTVVFQRILDMSHFQQSGNKQYTITLKTC